MLALFLLSLPIIKAFQLLMISDAVIHLYSFLDIAQCANLALTSSALSTRHSFFDKYLLFLCF